MATPRTKVRLALAALATSLFGAAGCAGLQEPLRSDLGSPDADVKACASWLAALDEAVERAGVRDAEAYPVPGFPHLRVNRFLAAFRTQAAADPAAFAAWQAQLRALDARTRGYELRNLPAPQLSALGADDWRSAAAHVSACGDLLSARDSADPTRRATLIARAQVPDDYADWKRVVGLYPLVRIPFFRLAKDWEAATARAFQQQPAEAPEARDLVRYQPPEREAGSADVAALFARVKRDALGIPELGAHDAEILFAAFAPAFEVDTKGDDDRIGALRWGDREAPEVDAAQPVVYRRLAFTRYGNETLVQVVYLIWFNRRPDASWLDLESGTLDGLFFRVTLDPHGRPLVYDSVHPCGCWHMFFPTELVEPVGSPDPDIEWAFAPRSLPAVAPGQRILLYLTAGSHQLTGIRIEPVATRTGVPYTMRDDGELRVLPTATGMRSAYGHDGIVPGSERRERFIVWTLGIDEPGAMREWGRHATGMVGRRHFDDADLIESRFAMRPPAEISAGASR